jgi:hypothetical protein
MPSQYRVLRCCSLLSRWHGSRTSCSFRASGPGSSRRCGVAGFPRCFDPVGSLTRPEPWPGSAPPTPSSGDREIGLVVLVGRLDPDHGGFGVFGRVGQCFRRHAVRGDFGGSGWPIGDVVERSTGTAEHRARAFSARPRPRSDRTPAQRRSRRPGRAARATGPTHGDRRRAWPPPSTTCARSPTKSTRLRG